MRGGELGTVTLVLTSTDKGFSASLRDAEGKLKDLEATNEQSSSRSKSGWGKFAGYMKGAFIGSLVAAGAAITATLVKNIDKAISRVDTLNNFPNIMKNLGYEAGDSAKALDKLDKGVRGLPTSLDQIAEALQSIAPSTKSLDEATDLTLALNNALVAGGKEAGRRATAMEQFSEAIARGKPDMEEWSSLATAMPGQLQQIAKSLGYDQWQQMAEAVSSGELAFSDVTDAMVKLNKDGLGEFPSFADQAKNSAGGLRTGMANMTTAIVRGMGDVINAIGSERISAALAGIGAGFEGGLKFVADFVRFIDENLPRVTGWFSQNAEIIKQVAVAIGTFLLPQILLFSGKGVAAVYRYTAAKVLAGKASLIAGAKMARGWLMALGPVGLIVGAVIAAVALIIMNWNRIKPIVTGVWNSIKAVWAAAPAWFGGIVRGIVNFFTSIPRQVVGIFNNAVGAVRNINWLSLGKNIVSGIASGLSPDAIVSKMKEIASSALDTVKSFLGIESPSRVMRDQVGKMIPAGIAGGISQATSEAVRAAQRSADAVIAGFGDLTAYAASPRLQPQLASADEAFANRPAAAGLAPGGFTQNVYASTDVDMQVINEDLMRRARRATP